MTKRFRYLFCAIVFAIVGGLAPNGGTSSQAQEPNLPAPTYIPQTKFDSGQDIVPVYEGWIRNPDGSFDFVFGYFNRNFKEELSIPAGPNNIVEPGGPDRGQPTYFLPRRQARLFRVRVPKDWGQKTLTWSITANGRAEKAYADLRAVEEISELIMQSGGNSLPFEPGNENPNKPPSITVAPVVAAGISTPVRLTANVTDDGLPKPRPPRTAPPQVTTPDVTGQIQRQINSGGAQLNDSGGGRGRGGLTVRWFQYGGPAGVKFNPAGPIPVVEGVAGATVRFPMPGAYKLVAIANDGQLSTRTDVSITVEATSTQGRP
jgi:hypothetical protein